MKAYLFRTTFFVALLIATLDVMLSSPSHISLAIPINPLTVAIASSLVSAGVGALRDRQRPDTPDLVSPAAVEGQTRRQALLRDANRSLDQVQDTQLSQGLQGNSLTEAIVSGTTDSLADIDGSIASLVADAGNRERLIEFDNRSRQFENTNSSIGSILQAATLVALNQAAGKDADTTNDLIDNSEGTGPDAHKAIDYMALFGPQV